MLAHPAHWAPHDAHFAPAGAVTVFGFVAASGAGDGARDAPPPPPSGRHGVQRSRSLLTDLLRTTYTAADVDSDDSGADTTGGSMEEDGEASGDEWGDFFERSIACPVGGSGEHGRESDTVSTASSSRPIAIPATRCAACSHGSAVRGAAFATWMHLLSYALAFSVDKATEILCAALPALFLSLISHRPARFAPQTIWHACARNTYPYSYFKDEVQRAALDKLNQKRKWYQQQLEAERMLARSMAKSRQTPAAARCNRPAGRPGAPA